MIFCLCKNVRDSVVKDSILAGFVTKADDLALLCGAGTDCGGCLVKLQKYIDTAQTAGLDSPDVANPSRP